jgi:hypothetical protein
MPGYPTGGHTTAQLPTAGQTEMLEDPSAWQALYNQAMGIPSAGRSAYQNWLSGQYGRAATQYSLAQADPASTAGMSFRDWISPTGVEAATARRDPTSWLGPTALNTFAGSTGQRQREIMERMPTGGGFNPLQTMLQSRFQTRGAPSWIARNLTRQAMGEAPQFAIDPQGMLAEGADAPSFLGYLLGRYGLGTATGGDVLGYEAPWQL